MIPLSRLLRSDRVFTRSVVSGEFPCSCRWSMHFFWCLDGFVDGAANELRRDVVYVVADGVLEIKGCLLIWSGKS
jgi:hypothetical protein